MPKKPLKDLLPGTWYRAGEEETSTEKVYRSLKPDEPVPRGRNREILTFKRDGTLIEGGIAPTDARIDRDGKWELHGNDLKLSSGSSAGPESSTSTETRSLSTRTLKIKSVDHDRLVISK